MINKLNRKSMGEDIHFSWITDTKFKNNRLSINFIVPLDPENASNNVVAMMLISKGSKVHPNFAKFNAKLNSLYGASVYTGVSKINKYQRLTLGIQFLDNRYALEKEDLVKDCTQLLLEMLFHPDLDENGEFREEKLKLEKQFLLDSIEAEINEKRTYAIDRMITEMYGNHPIAFSRYGTMETTEKVNGKTAAAALKNLLETANIEIMFTGSGKPGNGGDLFLEEFSKIERNPGKVVLEKISSVVEKEKKITQRMEGIQQGKLVMGMRIEGLNNNKEQYAARIFVGAYGGTPFSKLFLNVRERLSLCYYCAASINQFNNMVIVDSGVEEVNAKKAEEEIIKQLNSFKAGEFSDEELKNTKMLLKTSISSSGDSLWGIENWYMSEIIRGSNLSPEEFIHEIEKVTKEEVIAQAGKVTLDTVYLLTGKENA